MVVVNDAVRTASVDLMTGILPRDRHVLVKQPDEAAAPRRARILRTMEPGLDAVTSRHLLARVARAQRDGRLPSLVAALADADGVVWSVGRGRVDGRVPDPDTQYRIGSITKTFTAVLVMQLRDEGRLGLDDAVGTHLPGVGPAVAARSVRELLAHAGGARAETAPPWWERAPGRSWDALVADLDGDEATTGTRGRFHYSNVGYGVLGELVARLRGRSWAEAVRARILAPLGMRRTTVMPEPPAATGWAVHPWLDAVLAEPAHDAQAMAPAGQLWSTTADLCTWIRFLLGDTADVLDPATLEEMTQARVSDDPVAGVGYGLGLAIERPGRAGRRLVGHSGSMPGFLAGLWVDRADGRGAVVLANATSGLDHGLAAALLDVLRERHPPIPAEWAPRVPGDDAARELVGVWYWGPAPFALRGTGEGLSLAPLRGGGRRARLEPVARDTYRGRGGYFDGETMRVARRDDGTVSHLELASFVFTREPYDPPDVVPGGVEAPWHG